MFCKIIVLQKKQNYMVDCVAICSNTKLTLTPRKKKCRGFEFFTYCKGQNFLRLKKNTTNKTKKSYLHPKAPFVLLVQKRNNSSNLSLNQTLRSII